MADQTESSPGPGSETRDELPSARLRGRLLDAMLEIAGKEGWNDTALTRAAEAASLTPGEVQLATPNGVADLLDELGRRSAAAVGKALKKRDLTQLKVREKVRVGVKAYLAALEPHRAAVKRATGALANVLSGPKAVWAAADEIWAGLGDASTDYNWYTKRFILSGVIASTLVVWLEGKPEAELDAFLDRRIENVMQFEKAKAQVMDAFAKMPNPFDWTGKKKV